MSSSLVLKGKLDVATRFLTPKRHV